jgi:5-formyltetrahydrofolate cyclo-ligase
MSYSSPPCYLHELEGSAINGPTKSWDDIRAWRKQTREALIASRMALGVSVLQAKGGKAKQHLLAAVDLKQYATLGIYWSMRGEIDVRDIARKHIEAGGAVALPVVVEKSAPV